MKKIIYSLAFATALVATSCSDEISSSSNIKPDGEKEMISFSMTDEAGSVGALSTKSTRAGFTATTRILMRMRSKDASTNYRYTRTIAEAAAEASGKKYSIVSFDGSNKRYWDDAYGRDANISVFALAIPNQSSSTLLPEDKLTGAAAAGNYVNGTPWFTEATENETMSWTVSTDQSTATTIPNEDITYSNNIQPNPNTSPKPNGYDGVYSYDFSNDRYTPVLADNISNLTELGDGVMKFQLKDNGQPTGIGKFNKGHLIFNHALTRLTIHIRKGTGVTNENAFAFNTGGQIQVLNVPITGTFDIETGKWTTTSPGTITKMATATNKDIAANVHNYMAQFVPGYKFREGANAAANNVMQFTIDDNTYYITQDMIYKALTKDEHNNDINVGEKESDANGNFIEMKQGKNYDLTITVGKKQIETITATLVDWVYVTGTMADGDNSYVTLSLLDAITGENCKHFDLYRLDAGFSQIYTDQNGVTLPELYNWNGNYSEAAATLTETTEGTGSNVGVWKTNWYWESNKSFYHFRTIDKEMVIQGKADATNDYINIYSGPINDTWATGQNSVAVNDLKYNDYHWGAPMKSTATALTYSLTGSENELAYGPYIHSAIGSTHSTINMIEQHMMANIHIVLHTGKKADGTAVTGGKITLKDGDDKAVRVTLTNFVGNGIVELGRGLVNANGTLISSDIPVPGLTPAYTSNVLNSITGAADANYYTKQSAEEDITVSYNYRVVPQALYRGSDAANETDMTKFIGLTLVSPDNNQYYMVKKLYEVTASEITSNHGKVEHGVTSDHRQITRWFPGYDYTYHIYLNKKDIEAITCTVVDWVTVTGANKDITLED